MMKDLINIFRSHQVIILTGLDQALVSGSNFFLGLLITRYWGLDSYGEYVWVWFGASFFVGLQQGLVIAPMMDRLPRLTHEHSLLYLGSLRSGYTILICALFITLLPLVWVEIPLSLPQIKLFPTLCFTACWLIHDCYRKMLLTQKELVWACTMDGIGYGLFLISASLYLIFGGELLSSLISLQCIFLVLSSLFAGIRLPKFKWGLSHFKELAYFHWKWGKWLTGQQLIQFFSGNLFIIAAGIRLGEGVLGSIRIVQNLMGVYNVMFLALDNIIPIQTAKIQHHQGNQAMLRYLGRQFIPLAAIFFMFTFVLILTGRPFLSWVYQKDLPVIGPMIYGFCGLYIIIFLGYPLRFALRASGKTEIIFSAYIISMVFSILTADLLVLHWNWIGVIVGLAATQIIMQIYYGVSLRRIISISG